MDKQLRKRVDKLVTEIVDISGRLSELQDDVSNLIDEAYDCGVSDGYEEHSSEVTNETKTDNAGTAQ